uniref:DNA2/NAM7 helicase-like C-terminal domain-containing protein n=1 Tax=Klebsiella pneumoniae TaxID=573 RepID=A0A8B0SZM6_KLEPN|nr:hypothetical protein [Klebsiella pneumoniae]
MALRHQYSLTPDDVFLISPFKDCAKQLNRIAKRLGFRMDRTGTVHKNTGQGSYCGYPRAGRQHKKSQGAKARAAEKPNLLNVAVSRAKQRIYVIGERALWEKQPYFFHAVPGTGKAGCAGEQQQPACDVIYGRVLNH